MGEKVRILAIADEMDEALYGEKLHRLRPEVIVSCGDLPFDYLENLVSRSNVPLAYVPGNHDIELHRTDAIVPPLLDTPGIGPQGCDNVDGRVLRLAGLSVAGLGGSLQYNTGPNQYTQRQMSWRALRLETRVRMKRAFGGGGLDVLVTHAPPLGCGDQDDLPHRGFAALHRIIDKLGPRLLIHGHVHPFGRRQPDCQLGDTLVVNAVPFRLLEL